MKSANSIAEDRAVASPARVSAIAITSGGHGGGSPQRRIADAIVRHQAATEDQAFKREAGRELLIEPLGYDARSAIHGRHGRFRIDGVAGPDEYSAIADNNVYTLRARLIETKVMAYR